VIQITSNARDTTPAQMRHQEEKTMLRKIALGLVAAASISVTALLPTAASAHGLGWSWGWGYPGYVSAPTIVLSAPVVTVPCIQKMPVQTRHGIRYRFVKTCGF
jgi:hypothetical protein